MDASEPGSAKPSISTEVQDGESSAPVILQILPMLETGGVERGTVDITAAIAKAGGIPLVVSGGGPMVREVERAGGEHISLPVHSKNPLVMRRSAAAGLISCMPAVGPRHGAPARRRRGRAPVS